MSEEYVFTADRAKLPQLFRSDVAYRLFIWVGLHVAVGLAFYLHQPLTATRSLSMMFFLPLLFFGLALFFIADWWNSRVTISGSTLTYRSWLRSRQFQLTELTDVVITQTAAREIQQLMLLRGSVNHQLGLDINYMHDMKAMAQLVTTYVEQPRYITAHSEPLSKLLLIFAGSFGLVFIMTSFYSLDLGLLLLLLAGISGLARFYPEVSDYLPSLTSNLEGKIMAVALFAIGYGVYYHGPAGHPCGYVAVWVNQTHCIRAWSDLPSQSHYPWSGYALVGISADGEQILVQNEYWVQIEPVEAFFPVWQRQFTPIGDPSLTSYLYEPDRLLPEKVKSIVTNSPNNEPSTSFAYNTQFLALFSKQTFLIYQLPEVELIAEIPLPAGFTNLDPKQGCLAFAPEQPWLTYYQPGVGLLMLDVTTQETVQQFTTSGKSKFCFLAFAPEKNELVTLEGDVLRWRTVGQAEPGRELQLFTTPSRLALSPNGRWLALQDGQGVYLLDLR